MPSKRSTQQLIFHNNKFRGSFHKTRENFIAQLQCQQGWTNSKSSSMLTKTISAVVVTAKCCASNSVPTVSGFSHLLTHLWCSQHHRQLPTTNRQYPDLWPQFCIKLLVNTLTAAKLSYRIALRAMFGFDSFLFVLHQWTTNRFVVCWVCINHQVAETERWEIHSFLSGIWYWDESDPFHFNSISARPHRHTLTQSFNPLVVVRLSCGIDRPNHRKWNKMPAVCLSFSSPVVMSALKTEI